MPVKEVTHFGLPESAVSPWGTDTANPPRCSPPRDSLWVDSEECGYFPRSEQALTGAVHRDYSLVPDGLCASVAETRELSHKRQLYPSIRNIPSEQSVKPQAVLGPGWLGWPASAALAAVHYARTAMRATLSYTLLRLLIFFAAALVLALFGVRGFVLILAALAISAIVSLPLLSKLRDRMSTSLTGRVQSFNSKLDAGTKAEDSD
jgi:hypothetical protein